MSLIGLLVGLIVILIVIFGAKAILDACEVGGPIRTLILLVVALVCLLILLNLTGLVGAPMRVW